MYIYDRQSAEAEMALTQFDCHEKGLAGVDMTV